MSTKVIVIENTEGIMEILTISLASDLDVLSVPDTEKALSLVSKEKPPVLIFDMTLPGLDGIDFLCKVKKKSPHTEVITITDSKHKDLGISSLKYEASDFIIKPVKSDALEIILERALRNISIKKKLSPQKKEASSPLVDNERLSVARQMLSMMSESRKASGEADHSITSGIVSLHVKKGIILSATDEYKKRFGNLEGKNSWEAYKRGTVTPENCPVAMAFKTGKAHSQEAVLSTKHGGEIMASIYAAPLINQNDDVDLVVEIITV